MLRRGNNRINGKGKEVNEISIGRERKEPRRDTKDRAKSNAGLTLALFWRKVVETKGSREIGLFTLAVNGEAR